MGHTKLFFKRIGLAYLLYFVLRLLFFLFHLDSLKGTGVLDLIHAFFVGLIFDSSAIVYGFSPFILLSLLPFNFREKSWYQNLLKLCFVVCAFVAIVLSSIDFEFSKFTGKRSGIELFTVATDEGNSITSYFADYWYLAIIMIALTVVVFKLYPKFKGATKVVWWKEAIALVLIAGLCLLGARGGIGLKPIKSFAAAKYVEAELVQLTINTPFNFISTAEGEAMHTVQWLPEEEVKDIVQPWKNYHKESSQKDKPNVVLLILESFGREYIGHLGGEKGCTPFLDALASKEDCVSMTNFYSNGNVSMDAVPSLISGIPNWMDVSYSNSIYQTNAVENLGASLEKMGYVSKFYHGSKTGTMGFNSFLNMGGLSKYYGIEDYPNRERDFDGNWGIFDAPYLNYVSKEISKESAPTFTTVFTLSSHHPYPIPEHLKDTFKGYKGKIQRSVAYTDYAVKKFFEHRSKEPGFKNTIFLITADHTSFSKNEYYNAAPGRYEVPLMIYTPGDSLGIKEDLPSAHKDVLPTVLDYVNYPDTFYSLGHSILRPEECKEVILYSNGLYWIGNGNKTWLTMTKEGTFNSYFNQSKGEKRKQYMNGDERMPYLLKQLKANVQEFNNGVISNQLKKH